MARIYGQEMIPVIECICGEIIAKSEDGVLKIRQKIIIVNGSGTTAICKSCGGSVPIPLVLSPSATAPALIVPIKS